MGRGGRKSGDFCFLAVRNGKETAPSFSPRSEKAYDIEFRLTPFFTGLGGRKKKVAVRGGSKVGVATLGGPEEWGDLQKGLTIRQVNSPGEKDGLGKKYDVKLDSSNGARNGHLHGPWTLT